jgi:hypothetical protein
VIAIAMTPLLRCAAALALSVAALAQSARAAPVIVNDRPIELPVPAGYCPVDRARTPDAQGWDTMAALQEPQNRLLAWFAACNDLEAWRADPARGLAHHATVLLPAAARDAPWAARADVVAEVVRGFAQGEGSLTDDGEMARRLQERAPELTLAGPTRLELIDRNADGVFAALTQEVQGPAGPRRVIAVVTFTALAGTPLTTNFYGPDTGPGAVAPVQQAAAAYLAALVAANPEPPPFFDRRRLAAAAAVVLLLGAFAIFWRARRRA